MILDIKKLGGNTSCKIWIKNKTHLKPSFSSSCCSHDEVFRTHD